MSARRVAVLAGDGIGPEVIAPTLALLNELGDFEFEELLIGAASLAAHAVPLTESAVERCMAADAVLVGAAGDPAWDHHDPRPEQGLLSLRRRLSLFANLRPIRPHPRLADASPIRPERLRGTDMLIVRELTGGLYFGERGRADGRAYDTCVYTEAEVERVARVAFGLARTRVTSVDKANVLSTSVLWREVVQRIHDEEYPHLELEHLLVDTAAMQLVSTPARFDVVLAENTFGDILSDEAGVLTGSLGLLPSASLGAAEPGLFEPVHGSAPDIAGRGVANPLGAFLSAALMLRHGLSMEREAVALELAVSATIEQGVLTADLGGTARTAEVADAVRRHLS